MGDEFEFEFVFDELQFEFQALEYDFQVCDFVFDFGGDVIQVDVCADCKDS
jgi:hypothetical protein